MTKIIQAGPDTYELNKEAFISFWFKTLVERESMLKFQNTYTATLLNCDPHNPIFENPPFVRDESSKQFSISQSDFRSRRLSLISCKYSPKQFLEFELIFYSGISEYEKVL